MVQSRVKVWLSRPLKLQSVDIISCPAALITMTAAGMALTAAIGDHGELNSYLSLWTPRWPLTPGWPPRWPSYKHYMLLTVKHILFQFLTDLQNMFTLNL